MSMQKNMMLFGWFLKFGAITPRDDYSVHDYVKAKFCPEYMQEQELDEKEQLLRDTPGPVSIKYAYYVGSRVNGMLGALFALLATLLPVIIISVVLVLAYPTIADIERRIEVAAGIYAAALGLIAAQVFKIAHFNKIKRRSFIIILPAALIFLFLPGITGIGMPGTGTSLMPVFILLVIIAGVILGVTHERLEKYKKNRPPKYIDPYSKKAIRMRDKQLREEEYDMQKYRSDDEMKELKEKLKEKMRIKKYRDND